VFKQGVSILELHLFDLIFNFIDFLLLIVNLFFIFQLTLVVVLDDFEFLESFSQDFILVKVRVQLSSDGDVVLLEILKLSHHLFVDILLDSGKQSLLGSSQFTVRILSFLFLE